MRLKFALFAASIMSAPLLLTGCATSAPSREPADMPLPPHYMIGPNGELIITGSKHYLTGDHAR